MQTKRSTISRAAIATVTVMLALCGVGGTASAAHAEPQPTFTVSAEAAAPGSTLTVSGAQCYGDGYKIKGTLGEVDLPVTIVHDETYGAWTFDWTVPGNFPLGAADFTLSCFDFDDFLYFNYAVVSITIADPPTTEALTSSGTSPASQAVIVTVPDDGTLALLFDGDIVTTVTIAGQGVYSTDAGTSTIIFTPEAGFVGTPTPVSYRVTDSNLLTSDNTYTPTVSAAIVFVSIFDANLGDGTMASASHSTATILPANTFTRTGYTFTGWNTLADGTGTAYGEAAVFPFTASATLYAQWRALTGPIAIALKLDLAVGDVVEGAPYVISGSGLLEGSTYTVTLRSTPRVLIRDIVNRTGSFSAVLVLPAGVPAGQHTLTLDGIGYDGVARSSIAYITVSANGTILYASNTKAETLPETGSNPLALATVALLLLSAGVVLRLRRARIAE